MSLIPGVEGPREARVWRCWELEEPPSFALEIVGRDVAKDDEDVLIDSEAIGVRELVVFDPDETSAQPNAGCDGKCGEVRRTRYPLPRSARSC